MMKVQKTLASIVLIIGIFALLHCNDSKNDTSQRSGYKSTTTVDSLNDTHKTELGGLHCHALLKEILLKSGYDTLLLTDSFDVWIDDIDDNALIFKSFHKNEEGIEVTSGWFEIRFQTEELLDVTKDPDQPTTLIFEAKEYIKKLKECQN